jgi:T-complex protein 11
MKSNIIYFLSLKTFEQSKQYMVSIRDIVINGCTLIQSRSLWFSLLLYKYRDEYKPTDDLWKHARMFILETLRNQCNQQIIDTYLSLFNEWKKQDYLSFINEVVGYYVQILHLKETIEETKEETTISEWQQSYRSLLYKIRDGAKRMGFLDVLDEKVKELEHTRQSIVKDIMHRAYWDMLEEDIRHQQYTSTLFQLSELKNLVKDIIPAKFHQELHDVFDMDYITQRIDTLTLDYTFLIGLCRWIIESLKEWDNEASSPLYDRELEIWESKIEKLEWPTFIRYSIELCTVLALDTKTRVSVWRSLLNI